jgi:hypothetical protein
MIKKLAITLSFLSLLAAQGMFPIVTYAAAGDSVFNVTLIPCGNTDGIDTTTGQPLKYTSGPKAGQPIPAGEQCGMKEFIQLIKNVMNFLFLLSVPLSTISFVWVGVMYLTAQGNPSKIERAKGIAWKVLLGFIIICSAWLIVNEITRRLFKPEFQYLGYEQSIHEII